MNPSPLEILTLAETRRRDPDLAMWIADASAAQAETTPNPKEAKKNERTNILKAS